MVRRRNMAKNTPIGSCEHLRHEEHELRDRLAYTPYGEERERLQYRLGQVNAERERCWSR
jgi:hypothetical protein